MHGFLSLDGIVLVSVLAVQFGLSHTSGIKGIVGMVGPWMTGRREGGEEGEGKEWRGNQCHHKGGGRWSGTRNNDTVTKENC